MPLLLTCSFGARFEVEDSQAGQMITCPACDRPLTAPGLDRVPLRTSGLAIASVVLALVGAFTLLGTLAAVALGGVALINIAQNPDRVTGKGYAIFGIVAGIIFTGLTLFAFTRGDWFGLERSAPRWFR